MLSIKNNQRCKYKVVWTSGHPEDNDDLLFDPDITNQEKWKSLSERDRIHQRWLRSDWGILIADSELKKHNTNDNLVGIYGNKFDHYAPIIQTMKIEMTDVVEQILANYEVLYWILLPSRAPILSTLKDKMQEHKFTTYLTTRDDDRESRGKEREYEGGAYALTSRIWNL